MLDTIPLLSPTMELDLLTESWPAIDLFNNLNMQKKSTSEEENSVHSIWEENYQDLSGWCIDTFQGRCAFPIGEFEGNKYSGMESEDNVVSIEKTGTIGRVVSKGLPGDQASFNDSSLKVPKLPLVESETRNIKVEDLQVAIKSEIIDTRPMGINDASLLDPFDSSINQRTDDWIQFGNADLSTVSPMSLHHKPINHKRGNNVISVEYPSTILHEVAKDEKNNRETINTFDDTQSETFDLLSYLCDDNIQSPDGSIISRDSEPTIASNSPIASSADETSSTTTTTTMATTRALHKREKRIVASRRDYAGTDTSSSASIAAISAALDSVAEMSERSSRNRQKRNSTSMRNEYEIEAKKGRHKKRCFDSESEDRLSDDGSYRESREKNNEASRKSRQNKKAKENEMMMRASELEKDNRILRMKVDELDKLVTSMRTAILRSAMRKTS